MHPANEAWWRQVREIYPHVFSRRRVLEVGSRDVNGSVRQFFDGCEYVGVDWRAGPGVDVVALAHDMDFSEPFDTVVSASMLEHDPYWPRSLVVMTNQLNQRGALLLSWGAAENSSHCRDTAPDGLFHALPAWKVLNVVRGTGMFVERFMYEAQVHPSGGWGECGLLAFREREYGLGLSLLSELRDTDREPLEA